MDTALVITLVALLGLSIIYVARRLGLYTTHKRLVMSRFVPLQTDLNYNDEACLRLLLDQFSIDEPAEEGRQQFRHRPTIPDFGGKSRASQIDVSIAGTSIPLTFLWVWIKDIVLGKPDVFFFVLSRNVDQVLLIEAWRQNDDAYFHGWSSVTDGADPLKTAIRHVAEQIRAAYPLYQRALLDQYVYEARYSAAIELLDQILSPESEHKLSDDNRESLNDVRAWAYYRSGEYARAREMFEAHRSSDTEAAYIDCLIGTLEYDEALKEIESPRCSVAEYNRLLKLAHVLRAQRKLDPAIEAYEACIVAATEAFASGDEALDAGWCLVYANRHAAECMLALDNYFERDRYLDQQRVAARNLREHDASGDPLHYEALAFEDSGQFDEAANTYRESIEVCELDRSNNPDDVDHIAAHGWALSGLSDALYQSIRDELRTQQDDEEARETIMVLSEIGGALASKEKKERLRIVSGLASGEIDPEPFVEFADEPLEKLKDLRSDKKRYSKLVSDAIEHMEACEAASGIFGVLAEKNSNMHKSEGHYGQACIYAMFGREDLVCEELLAGASADPALIESACWDSDFAELRREACDGNAVVTWDPDFDWFTRYEASEEH